MTQFLLVCLGGALGSGARFGLSKLSLPFSTTLLVNAIGSFCIAFLLSRFSLSLELRNFLIVGFLGGFTTYSAFNQEMLTGFEQGAWMRTGFYAIMMIVVCVLFGFLGSILGRRFA